VLNVAAAIELPVGAPTNVTFKSPWVEDGLGTPDEGSDLDLFVVVPESNEPPVERMRRAHRCLCGLGITKDVLVKTRQEFDRLRALPSTLDHLVFHRGRRLYG
jgi:hypothetical protein